MKMKKSLLSCFVLLMSLCLMACQHQKISKQDTSLTDVKKNGKLIVATETGFAPFTFKMLKDGKDMIVGSDIDMVKKIADQLEVSVEFKEMSFDNVLSAVQTGQADIGISGISMTKERQKVFDFSTGYYQAKTKIIIQKSDQNKIINLSDLDNQSIAAQKGSIQESVVSEQISNGHLVSLTETGEMIMELKHDKVKAVVLEEPIAKAYVAKNPELMIIEDINLSSTDSETYGIILPKGNTALKEAIDTILTPMVASGEIDQMIQDAYDQSVGQ